MAGATKRNKDTKSKKAAGAQHEANRRFKLRHGVKRSKYDGVARALEQALAAKEKKDE